MLAKTFPLEIASPQPPRGAGGEVGEVSDPPLHHSSRLKKDEAKVIFAKRTREGQETVQSNITDFTDFSVLAMGFAARWSYVSP